MPIVYPRIMINNIGDKAGISASPAFVPTLPETFLQQQERSMFATTTSIAAQDIKLSWPANQSVNMVALCRHNLTAGAQMRVRTYSDSAWTTPITDHAAANCFSYTGISVEQDITDPDFLIYKNSVRYLALAANVRSMIITITDPGNLTGAFTFSRLMVGKYWEFAYGIPYLGAPASTPDMSIQGRSRSGFLSTDKRARYAALGINPEFITMAADYMELSALVNMCGLSRDFWVSLYPTDGSLLELQNHNVVKLVSIPVFDRDLPGSLKSQIKMECT